ncbi:MAG TPA: hypothetical protein PKY87_12160 [Terricaulis sp.]|nr:hypothetical protein [Terricaulis sp.]
MKRAVLIVAAILAACSPASNAPGSSDAPASDPPPSMGSFAAAPENQVVYLNNYGAGQRVQVEVGQVLVLRATIDRTIGEDLRPVDLPDFIEFFGRRNHIDRSTPRAPNDGRTGETRSGTVNFIFFAQTPGEGELVLQSYSSRYPDYPVEETLRVTIVARAPLSDVIGARDAPSNPAVMPAVQLGAAPWHGRVEVAVGQEMHFQRSFAQAHGEVVEGGVVPDFVEYVGAEASNPGGPDGDADYVFTFVARQPGVGVLTMQQYNQRAGRTRGYEVLKVLIVAR